MPEIQPVQEQSPIGPEVNQVEVGNVVSETSAEARVSESVVNTQERLRDIRDALGISGQGSTGLVPNTFEMKAPSSEDIAFGRKGFQAERPPEISADENVPAFTQADIEAWQHGGEKFKEFMSRLDAVSREEVSNGDLGNLQMMFLREKPAIFQGYGLSGQAVADCLKDFGIHSAKGYLYDPEQVSHVISSEPDLFKQFGSTDPDEVMKMLADKDNEDASVVRGLVLGFPKDAVLDFEVSQQLRISPEMEGKIDAILSNSADKKRFHNFLHHVGNMLPDTEEVYGGDPYEDCEFIKDQVSRHERELGLGRPELDKFYKGLELLRFRQIATDGLPGGMRWAEFRPSKESELKQRRIGAATAYLGDI